ncbi:mucin-5AC-like isoform X2 [Zophobas morio]|uniref:mucin-5AC-like isoform X2 n=1 Tax=Zophobas morio TaxID=2755281 RepID=UPI003082B077
MGGYAWVTLATNDSYSLGALVLANSLKQLGTSHQLVVLVTPGVTNAMRQKLSATFNVVQEVNILDSKDETNLRLLKRPELGVTFTKLHCWRLTQFDKCVFLDADTLVLRNCDELFDREELSAAPDVGWPDCFNSGVFVYRPSNETYEKLVQFALEKGSFDGGDQGLLNLYFSDWATKDISKHLPFIYNMCSTACYSYLPAFKQFGVDAKIIHFIGSSKPWLQYFNTETRKVQPSSDVKHLEGILQHWWNIFCSLIHPQLTTEMPNEGRCDECKARSSSDVTHTSLSSCTSQNYDKPQISTKNIVWDPWEEYDQKQSQILPQEYSFPEEIRVPFNPVHKIQETHIFRPSNLTSQPFFNSQLSQIKPIESHNTNAYDRDERPQSPIQNVFQKSKSSSFQNNKSLNSLQQSHLPVEIPTKVVTSPPEIVQNYAPPTSSDPIYSCQDAQLQSQLLICVPNPASPTPHVHSNESEAAATVYKEPTLHVAPCEDESSSGLAGAFAQLTLGAPRTAEQCALDDHLRRQGWEVGNIDYMGRDSFDNIWSKICETLSAGLPSAPKTTDATPSPTVRESEKSASEEAQPSPQTTSFQDSTSAAPISQSIPLESQIISESKASPETPVKTPGASEGSFALVTPESGDLQCPLRVAEQPKEIAEVVQQVAATEPPVAPVLKTAEEKIASPQEGQASVSPPTAPTIQPSVEAAPTSQTSGETVTSSTPAESPLSSQPSSELPPASSPSVETPATLQPSGETPTAPQPSSEISTTPQLSGETPLTLQTSSEVLSTSQSLAEAPTLSQPSIETPPSPGVPQLPEVAPQQPEVAPQQPEVAPQQPEVAPQQPEVAPQQPEVVPQLSEVVPSQPVAETALISPPATEAPAPSKLSKEVLSPIAQPTTECTPISKPPTEVETPPSSQADTEGLPSPKAVTGASKSEVPSTQPSTEIPPISPLSTQVPPSTKSTAEIVKPPIEALSSQPSADTALSQPSTETPSTTKPKQPSIESPSTVTETPAAETSAPEPSVVVPPTSKPAPSAEVSTPSKVDSPPSDTDKSKSVTEQSKAAPKPKPESTSAASSVSPTPPPRKTGGGGKKKSKK